MSATNLLHFTLDGATECSGTSVQSLLSRPERYYSHLESLSIRNTPHFGADTIHNLRSHTIQLHGPWDNIKTLCAGNIFNTVRNKLVIDVEHGPGQHITPISNPVFFGLITSSFPNVSFLFIGLSDDTAFESRISIQDLLGLGDLPIKQFSLSANSHTLVDDDIITLIETWPTLASLEISGRIFDPIKILGYLLNHATAGAAATRLEYLKISFKFDPVERVSLWRRSSPTLTLRKLVLPNHGSNHGIPNNVKKQIILAKALVRAFPRLDITLEGWDESVFGAILGT